MEQNKYLEAVSLFWSNFIIHAKQLKLLNWLKKISEMDWSIEVLYSTKLDFLEGRAQ